MVKEKVLFDSDRFDRLKEDITVYEELLKDVVNVFSSVLTLGVHSGTSITRLVKHIGDDCIERESYGDDLSKCAPSVNDEDRAKKAPIFFQSLFNDDYDDYDDDDSDGNVKHQLNTNHANNFNKRYNIDEDTDLIRFTNNGPLFKIAKSVLDKYKGSYIDEQRSEELRTNDGTIYLGYDGNDGCAYYLMDYLNGKRVDFTTLEYSEQFEFVELFEFCNLPLPPDLITCREKKKKKNMKLYKKSDDVVLLLNGAQNTTIKDYLKKRNQWESYIMNYESGLVLYNASKDISYINIKYKYQKYILQYVTNGYLEIPDNKISTIDKDILIIEMYSLFGDTGKEAAQAGMTPYKRFSGTKIITKEQENVLMKWLGPQKSWKLLYIASANNFSAKPFHKMCDNKGETVTLIKHIGHNNHINIFGGYTDQSWDKSHEGYKSYSDEFIFTLSNEHGVPPTKYKYCDIDEDNAIYCSKERGPCFGSDITITDRCHYNNNSYCIASSYKEVSTFQKHSLFVNTDSSDSYNWFVVDNYEVWGRA
ncbi:hypothetical protein WA158_005303 [Blastocystis sp. Blastoise]